MSLVKLSQADIENAKSYLTEALERFEDMHARGVLAPVDVPLIDALREALAG